MIFPAVPLDTIMGALEGSTLEENSDIRILGGSALLWTLEGSTFL